MNTFIKYNKINRNLKEAKNSIKPQNIIKTKKVQKYDKAQHVFVYVKKLNQNTIKDIKLKQLRIKH